MESFSNKFVTPLRRPRLTDGLPRPPFRFRKVEEGEPEPAEPKDEQQHPAEPLPDGPAEVSVPETEMPYIEQYEEWRKKIVFFKGPKQCAQLKNYGIVILNEHNAVLFFDPYDLVHAKKWKDVVSEPAYQMIFLIARGFELDDTRDKRTAFCYHFLRWNGLRRIPTDSYLEGAIDSPFSWDINVENIDLTIF